MVAPKRYHPVGVCIYCGASASEDKALGEEHIIPRGLGGKLVLPAASCLDCGAATSRVESACMRSMLHAARPYFGIKGRKSKKVASTLPVFLGGPPAKGQAEGPRKQISIADHPSLITLFRFGEADIWTGREPTLEKGVAILLIQLRPSAAKLLAQMGAYLEIDGIRANTVALMLAKIGHAYAVAELGLSGFRPFLPDLILGRVEASPLYWVGERTPQEPPSDQLHTIKLVRQHHPEFGDLWSVRIRLFAQKDTLTYDIVVGAALK